METNDTNSINKKLSAIIALMSFSLFATSEEKADAKPEVILAQSGLDYTEIASILGKKSNAVRMVIKRNKKR